MKRYSMLVSPNTAPLAQGPTNLIHEFNSCARGSGTKTPGHRDLLRAEAGCPAIFVLDPRPMLVWYIIPKFIMKLYVLSLHKHLVMLKQRLLQMFQSWNARSNLDTKVYDWI